VKTENFFKTCNNMNVPEKDFRNIFCNRCKNPRCAFSEGGDSPWANRILTQEDRLLNNPKFAHKDDPQFNNIRAQKFLSILHEAIELNSQERAADWTLKWEEAQPQMFVPPAQESEPLVEEQPAPIPEPVVEVQKPVVPIPVELKEEIPVVKKSFLNTPFPSEGVMLDGSPVTPQEPKSQTPPPDPWDVPKKPTNVVAVGAKVVMGGSGGKKNGP
jgi:hypothetical protein